MTQVATWARERMSSLLKMLATCRSVVLTAYFGVGSLALAVGGALGNGSGGALIDISARVGLAWLPWIGMCAVAIASAIGFAWLQRDAQFQRRLAGHPLKIGRQRVPVSATRTQPLKVPADS